MMNEIHAGLHARYLEERHEVVRCKKCQSYHVSQDTKTSLDNHSIDSEYLFCFNCEQQTGFDVETFDEWAERKDINLEEL